MKRKNNFLTFNRALLCIVGIGLCVRLYKINTPLADWHSFRQADTASVTREYVKHGIDLLHPTYHDLSNIQSGVRVQGADNVQGLRMVEFPIVNGVIANVLRFLPFLDIVVTSRLFSVSASLFSMVFLALLGKELYGKKVGLLAATAFALIPYNVYYSRTILPEPFLVASVLGSLYFFWWYQKKNSVFSLLLSALLFSLALLLKPMAVFFIPVYIALAWQIRGKKGLLDIVAAVLFAATLIPLYFWRKWIAQYPIGIPASDWLFNGNGIRLRPAWFRWLFWERLTKLVLGYTGVSLFVAGLLKKDLVLWPWALGMLAYLIVFATGNVQHDYYQVMLMPFVCLTIAKGVSWVWSAKIPYIQTITTALIVISLYFAWNQIKGYYNINNWAIVHAGQAADIALPQDAKVIAPYQGDTAFLFQINRTGWPIGFEIDKKISEGAQYYVSVNYDDEARALEKKYQTVQKTPEFIILNLQNSL
ncbi:MAG: phospholipid carrier-dependent glycosyltransferase [Candidatus Woesebacteria bacterium]